MPLEIKFADTLNAFSPAMEFSGDIDVPPESEWAKPHLKTLWEGIQEVGRNESALFGETGGWLSKNRLLYTLAKEQCLVLSQNASMGDIKDHILLNASELERAASRRGTETPSFFVGHLFGKYFNSMPEYKWLSGAPLFALAARLENITAHQKGQWLEDDNLFQNVDERLRGKPDADAAHKDFNYYDELFATAFGLLLSERQGVFAGERLEGTGIHIPSLLLKYLRGPVTEQLIYRTTPRPAPEYVEEHQKFVRRLFGPTGGMDKKQYDKILGFITESESRIREGTTRLIDEQELQDATRQVKDTLTTFETQKALAAKATSRIQFS